MAFLNVRAGGDAADGVVLIFFVASIAVFQFWRAGYFSWRSFGRFALTSIPFAFSRDDPLPTNVLQICSGSCRIAALRLAWEAAADR